MHSGCLAARFLALLAAGAFAVASTGEDDKEACSAPEVPERSVGSSLLQVVNRSRRSVATTPETTKREHSVKPRSELCREFFVDRCGLANGRFAEMESLWELSAVFKVCCLMGGHGRSTCDSLMEESFSPLKLGNGTYEPVAADSIFCSELNTLYTAHIIWTEDNMVREYQDPKNRTPLFSINFELLPPGQLCRKGHEVLGFSECHNAIQEMGLTPLPIKVMRRRDSKYLKPDVPPQCSYRDAFGTYHMYWNALKNVVWRFSPPRKFSAVCHRSWAKLPEQSDADWPPKGPPGGYAQPSVVHMRLAERVLPALVELHSLVPHYTSRLLGGAAAAAALVRHRATAGALVLRKAPKYAVSAALFALSTHLQSCARAASR